MYQFNAKKGGGMKESERTKVLDESGKEILARGRTGDMDLLETFKEKEDEYESEVDEHVLTDIGCG